MEREYVPRRSCLAGGGYAADGGHFCECLMPASRDHEVHWCPCGVVWYGDLRAVAVP